MTHRLSLHETRTFSPRPHFACAVPAGFPSPADDYADRALDLNEHLIRHEAATFYCRASGRSMEGAGIFDDDLLIVDRAVTPVNGSVVIALVDGALACKILDIPARRLLSANPEYPPIDIAENMELVIEGVVTHSIRSHGPG